MPVQFLTLAVGTHYTRPQLAAIWGYRGHAALSRGVVTPATTKYIVLFITRNKQALFTQYQDDLYGDVLTIEGETSHTADRRLVRASEVGDEVHLFYRDRHHTPFEYKGRVYLVAHQIRGAEPSRFEFVLSPTEAAAADGLGTERRTHGDDPDTFTADEEGRRRLVQSVSYERSVKNRARALAVHGTSCLACGFSFDARYGAAHAAAYIEVHHVRSVAAGATIPNPETDLLPLCSNCHSMAHRRMGMCLNLAELRALLIPR